MSSLDDGDELRAALTAVAARWAERARSLSPIRHAEAERSLCLAYECAGRSAPTVIQWATSPPVGLRMLASLTPVDTSAARPMTTVDLVGGLRDRTADAVRHADFTDSTSRRLLESIHDRLEEQLDFGLFERACAPRCCR